MTTELILGDDGQQYAVGTLVPDPSRLKSNRQPRLRDVMKLLTRDELMDIYNDPDLPTGRKRWSDSSLWTFDQGPIGKCACSASKGLLMRARDLQGLPYIELSDDYIYPFVNDGRDQGALLIDVINHIEEIGTCPAEFVKQGTIKKRDIRPEAHANANYKALKSEWCQVLDRDEMETANALVMPTNIAWHFTNASPRLDRNGISSATRGQGNHSVVTDGLKLINNVFYFDTNNSHGARFGQRGRCYLGWDEHLRHTVNNHVFHALRVTESTSNTPALN